RELNIGVAKPSSVQLDSIHHYFINSHSIQEEVSVKTFEHYALKAVYEIFKGNDIAIMAGGTGLYIKAFCDGLDDIPLADELIRKEINMAYNEQGMEWLQNKIKKEDPLYFASGEMENPQRLLRALEVKLSTGKSIINFQSGKKIQRDFNIEKINLEIPRQILYERINRRVDEMMEQGLLKEAASLFPYRHLNALQTVGYRELFEFMGDKISLDEAIEKIKINTRHFAKRQITWFKKHLVHASH
ncbi:MAG: tRNA (adenosine(37)-N6)-dimethylallyltransferase MiaA, partial [Bacteroidota bacterium]|nr:tRNA (adenosine(37)-N6)-dimethylallyltransferase MiaA [Bacteroidota bacterium]